MFFVWFYAALSVARKSGQGFNARSLADKHCVAHSFGLSLTSIVLPTALVFRRQALCCSQLWSFADKQCVARSFGLSQTSRVLPTAITACVPWRLFLLPLRHVHLVHQVHQVHLAKCFVTRLAPQPCAKVKTLFKETGAVSFIEIRFEILILLLYINF